MRAVYELRGYKGPEIDRPSRFCLSDLSALSYFRVPLNSSKSMTLDSMENYISFVIGYLEAHKRAAVQPTGPHPRNPNYSNTSQTY